VAIADDTSSVTTFVAPQVDELTTLTFELNVWDNELNRSVVPASVGIGVQPLPNQAPVANAGMDQTAFKTSMVTLDGSGSSDPDNDTLTYNWVQTGGPTVTLSDPSAVKPQFVAPAVNATTTLTFRLTVNDGQYEQTDEVQIRVLNRRPLRSG
jgi:chitinase